MPLDRRQLSRIAETKFSGPAGRSVGRSPHKRFGAGGDAVRGGVTEKQDRILLRSDAVEYVLELRARRRRADVSKQIIRSDRPLVLTPTRPGVRILQTH